MMLQPWFIIKPNLLWDYWVLLGSSNKCFGEGGGRNGNREAADKCMNSLCFSK